MNLNKKEKLAKFNQNITTGYAVTLSWRVGLTSLNMSSVQKRTGGDQTGSDYGLIGDLQKTKFFR